MPELMDFLRSAARRTCHRIREFDEPAKRDISLSCHHRPARRTAGRARPLGAPECCPGFSVFCAHALSAGPAVRPYQRHSRSRRRKEAT